MKNRVKCVLSLEFHKIETELTEPASCCLLCMELIYFRIIQSWPVIIHAKKIPQKRKRKKSFIRKQLKAYKLIPKLSLMRPKRLLFLGTEFPLHPNHTFVNKTKQKKHTKETHGGSHKSGLPELVWPKSIHNPPAQLQYVPCQLPSSQAQTARLMQRQLCRLGECCWY